MIYVTSSDSRFWRITNRCITSLEEHARCDVYCFTVGCQHQYPHAVSRTHFIHMPIAEGAPNNCQHHGGYLSALKHIDGNETLVWLDADVVQQRPLTEIEIEYLSAEGTLFAGWNAGVGDHLRRESPRLKPRKPVETEWDLDYLETISCLNMGIFIGKKYVLEELHARYMKLWPRVDLLFTHPARNQWLTNLVVHESPNTTKAVLPYSFHVHDKWTFPEGAKLIGDQMWLGNKLVVWKHGWKHEA